MLKMLSKAACRRVAVTPPPPASRRSGGGGATAYMPKMLLRVDGKERVFKDSTITPIVCGSQTNSCTELAQTNNLRKFAHLHAQRNSLCFQTFASLRDRRN